MPIPDRLKEFRSRHVRKEINLPIAVYEQIEAYAKSQNISPNEAIKGLSLMALHGSKPIDHETRHKLDEVNAKLEGVSLLIRNIANNVNQISKHSNEIKQLVDYNNLLGHIKGLDDLIKNSISDYIK
jgi:methyl-accepting chemotaxis protein